MRTRTATVRPLPALVVNTGALATAVVIISLLVILPR
jgi:hypothetical protein